MTRVIDQPITLFKCNCGESQPEDIRFRVQRTKENRYLAYLWCRGCGNLEFVFGFESTLGPMEIPPYPTLSNAPKEELDETTEALAHKTFQKNFTSPRKYPRPIGGLGVCGHKGCKLKPGHIPGHTDR